MDTLQPTMKPTEVSALIKMAENSARNKLQPGVTLNTMLGATEFTVQTDGNFLVKIIMNLLTNACKFTSKGAITFGYEVYDDELYFFVKDTGIGIDADLKSRLTALFDHDDVASPGLGYGLPMSQSFVKKLGGHMGVESRGTGRGCNFWFTIPYVEPVAAPQDTTATGTANNETETVSMSSDRLTILVAEDNIANYLLFDRILSKKYNVLHAADGVEAVNLYQQHRPDLIIMDIQMPNMDGYGAVREIRKISPDVPIIAATAYAFVTDRQRLLENGFNGYLSKPINITRLEQEITNCLNKG